MKLMSKLKLTVAAFALSGGMALAAVDTEALVSDLQAQGYSWIEVKRGPGQIKIEAIKGDQKVETIIDAATGEVLKTETETASSEDRGREGVEIKTVGRDFVDGSKSDDDSNDDETDDDSTDDDGSDDDGSDDDGSDDDGDDNSGSDDGDDNGGNDDGDDNSGSGGGDDNDGGDDNGGNDDGDDNGGNDDGDDKGGDDGDDD